LLQRQGVSPTFRPTSVTHCLGRETTRVVVPRRCSRLGKTTIILLRIYYFWKGESGRGEVFSSHTLERPRAGRCKSLATHPARDGRCTHMAAPALGPFLRQAGAVIPAFWAFNVIQMVFRTSLSSFPLMLYPFRLIVRLSRACLAVLDLWERVFLSLLHSPK